MKETTASLSDEALVTRVRAGKRREDEATAAFLADLGEIYRRQPTQPHSSRSHAHGTNGHS